MIWHPGRPKSGVDRWSLAEIDAALDVVRLKGRRRPLDDSQRAWLDRLLDARPLAAARHQARTPQPLNDWLNNPPQEAAGDDLPGETHNPH